MLLKRNIFLYLESNSGYFVCYYFSDVIIKKKLW